MPSKSEPSNSSDCLENVANMDQRGLQNVQVKEEVIDGFHDEQGLEYDEENDKFSEDSSHPVDLPLEVITTIEPFNYAYPYLKNMSNGVLTHRNIFTEQEREVLRKIVDKYREIVDTRSRTREIYMEKQSVWQQIVEEYNSTENILMRTEKELKKCWDNMKYRARLAEKEQQKAENQCGSQESPDPHQIACNAVQVALEKMFSVQSQTSTPESNLTNGIRTKDKMLDFQTETKENWSSVSGLNINDNDSRFSSNLDFEKEEDKNMEDFFDDEQPLLKKARQESPKLSSILLGDAKKISYPKPENCISRSQYSIPNCTKVIHLKKKSKKSNSSNPVSILPKGLNSCVSIMNIPNPNQTSNSTPSSTNATLDFSSVEAELMSGAINLGSGITISPQKPDSFPAGESSSSSQTRQMPFLRKMFPNKIIKKSVRMPQNTSPPSHSSNGSFLDGDADREFLEEKLLLQRLEFGCQEHALKMKVLEKQLQAYANESQFWAIKMKMLKNGFEEVSGKILNGEL